MFPPPDSHERALPTASPSQNCLAAHLVVRGGSDPDRDPPEQKHILHPTPLSPARSLGRPYLKDAAAPPRPCVMASPVTQWAGPSPDPQTPFSLPWKLRQDLRDARLERLMLLNRFSRVRLCATR